MIALLLALTPSALQPRDANAGDDMWLLVGLGNPGAKYANNRHNIGFMAVDEIFDRHEGPVAPAWREKFNGQFAEIRMDGEKILLLKPMTYMNNSGQSVAAAARFYKIPPERIVVFHDELDLPPKKVRVKQAGGAGGHNGLKSIDSHMGKNYWRVRIGIGHPGDKDRVSGYVLSDFASADQEWIDPLLEIMAKEAGHLVERQPDKFMTNVAQGLSGALRPPAQKAKQKPPKQTEQKQTE